MRFFCFVVVFPAVVLVSQNPQCFQAMAPAFLTVFFIGLFFELCTLRVNQHVKKEKEIRKGTLLVVSDL